MFASSAAEQAKFVREIPKRTVKVFDLVDVVAGGNGFSGLRDRRHQSDRPANSSTDLETDRFPASDGKYHRVEGFPFIDGIFVPKGRNAVGATRFRRAIPLRNSTTRTDKSGGSALGGRQARESPAAAAAEREHSLYSTVLAGVDYSCAPHGVLFLHANKGVTFDLEAIRRANRGYKLLRFPRHDRQYGDSLPSDGRPHIAPTSGCSLTAEERFKRKNINGYSGVAPVAVSIRETRSLFDPGRHGRRRRHRRRLDHLRRSPDGDDRRCEGRVRSRDQHVTIRNTQRRGCASEITEHRTMPLCLSPILVFLSQKTVLASCVPQHSGQAASLRSLHNFTLVGN